MAGPGTRHRYQERADEELIFHYHNETERPTRAMTRNTHRTIFVMIASIGHVLRGQRHEFASARTVERPARFEAIKVVAATRPNR